MTSNSAHETPPEHAPRVFEYDRLDDEQKQVRLVRFSSVDGIRNLPSDPISLELEHFDLTEAPEYKALSYTWGEETFEEYHVFVDQKALRVRKNLFDFLQLKHPSSLDGWLWIDQLCIDQNALQERNEQVSRMGQIFQGAQEVIVWLDSTPPEEGMLEHMASRYELDSIPYDDWPAQPSEMDSKVIRALVQQNYWSRVWIVQEMLLARSLTLLWGTEEVRATHLHLFARAMSRTWTFSDPKPRKRDADFREFEDGDLEWRDHDLMSKIVDLLDDPRMPGEEIPFQDFWHPFGAGSSYATGGCADPRDHVYGLHALFSQQMQTRVPIDYSINASELLCRVLPHIVLDCYACQTPADQTKNNELLLYLSNLAVAMIPDHFTGGYLWDQARALKPKGWLGRPIIEADLSRWEDLIDRVRLHLGGDCTLCATSSEGYLLSDSCEVPLGRHTPRYWQVTRTVDARDGDNQ